LYVYSFVPTLSSRHERMNKRIYFSQGPSIKDVRSQRGGVCPVRTFFGQGVGVLQMRTSALFAQKTPVFRTLWWVVLGTHGQEGEGDGSLPKNMCTYIIITNKWKISKKNGRAKSSQEID